MNPPLQIPADPSGPKAFHRRGCATYIGLPLLALGLFFFVGIPSWKATSEWWKIRSALQNAKSVKLVHFNPYLAQRHFGGDIIYGTKELKPEEFSKVSAAFPPTLDFGMPSDPYGCIFDPHHKIIITDATGHETVIKVCFLCDHVQIGENNETFCTPFLWRPLLHKFFEHEGMPFTPDRYMPDYQKASKDTKIPNGTSQ